MSDPELISELAWETEACSALASILSFQFYTASMCDVFCYYQFADLF